MEEATFVKLVNEALAPRVDDNHYGAKQYIETLLEDCSSRKNTKELIESELLVPLRYCVQLLLVATDDQQSIVTRSQLIEFSKIHFKFISSFARNVTWRSAFHDAVPELLSILFQYIDVVNKEQTSQQVEELKAELLRFIFRVLQNYQQSLTNESLNRLFEVFVYKQFELSEARESDAWYEYETLMMCIDLCRVVCSHPELSKGITSAVTILHHVCKLFTLKKSFTDKDLYEAIQLLAHCSFVIVKQKKSYIYAKQLLEKVSSSAVDASSIDFDLLLQVHKIVLGHSAALQAKLLELLPEEICYLEHTANAIIYVSAISNTEQTQDKHNEFSVSTGEALFQCLNYLVEAKVTKSSRTHILYYLKVLRKYIQYNKVEQGMKERIYALISQIYTEAVSSNKAIYKAKAHSAIVKLISALLMQEQIVSVEPEQQELYAQLFANESGQTSKLLLVQRAGVAIGQSGESDIAQTLFSNAIQQLLGPLKDLMEKNKTSLARAELVQLLHYLDYLLCIANTFNSKLIKTSIKSVVAVIQYLMDNCTMALGYASIEVYITLCKFLTTEELQEAQFNFFVGVFNQLLLEGLQKKDNIVLKKDKKKDKHSNLDVESQLFYAILEFVEAMAAESEAFKTQSDAIKLFLNACSERVKKPITFELDEEERIAEASAIGKLVPIITNGSQFTDQEKVTIVGSVSASLLQGLIEHMKTFDLNAVTHLSDQFSELLSTQKALVQQFLQSLPAAKRKQVNKSARRLAEIMVEMRVDMNTAENPYSDDEEEADEDSENEEEKFAELEIKVKKLSETLMNLSK